MTDCARPGPLALRVDPWAPEYDASLQLVETDEEEVAPVDVTVERPVWAAVDPSPGPTPPLAIVDGVRRVELRVVAEVEGRICYGLFGSAAVGAACLGARAEIAGVRVLRFLVMGGGLVSGDRVVGAPGSALAVHGHRRGREHVHGPFGRPAGADAVGGGGSGRGVRPAGGRGGDRRRPPPAAAAAHRADRRVRQAHAARLPRAGGGRPARSASPRPANPRVRHPRPSPAIFLVRAPRAGRPRCPRLRGGGPARDLADHRARGSGPGGGPQRPRLASPRLDPRSRSPRTRRISCPWARWSII